MAPHRVDYTIREWEGIEFAIINANTDFAIFLRDDDDGT